MDTQKVNELTEIQTVSTSDSIMLLTDEIDNVVERTTVDNLLYNSISTDDNNALKQGVDKKLYVGSAINLYDSEYNYSQGQWVLDNGVIYKSLVDDNMGNPTSDTGYWEEVKLGGGSGNTYSLLQSFWSDCVLNRQDMLLADNFSWQPGGTYSDAYQHLVDDIDGKTLQSETIGTVTVQYYLADDGHKICPASEEQNVIDIYDNTGVAWYYILDTVNTRFKLPRTQNHGELIESGEQDGISYRIWSDGYCEQWGSNIVASTTDIVVSLIKTYKDENYILLCQPHYNNSTDSPTYIQFGYSKTASSFTYRSHSAIQRIIDWKACGYLAEDQYTPTNSPYQNLYFYVGQFSQTATEQTAGLNSELFNGKVDVSSMHEINPMIESYVNGTDGYNIWANGYCEQWGRITANTTITFIKIFLNTNYTILSASGATASDVGAFFTNRTERNMQSNNTQNPTFWKVCGYLAEGEY